jgi:hypothetical protein
LQPLRGLVYRTALAFLPESTRLLVINANGSVLVHADADG